MGRYRGHLGGERPDLRMAAIAVLAVVILVFIAGLLAGPGPARGAPMVLAGTTSTDPTPTAPPTPTATPTSTATPTGTPTTSPTPADGLLRPDLQAMPASEPTIEVRKDGRRLRFTSSLANVGIGPMEVRPNRARPCPAGQHNATQVIYRDGNGNGRYNPRIDTDVQRHRAGCMVFHRHHDHWHFKASARYILLDPSAGDRVVVSARRKVSFCLRDSAPVPARLGTWHYREAYAECGRWTPQGISIGWMDVYQNFLVGQALRLPDALRPGVYCLETVVDPIDELIETNDDNNRSMRALSIRGIRVERRDIARCL